MLVSNFNSHAHVERDQEQGYEAQLTPISTHTLTWSVTGAGRLKLTDKYISTHTLTWSVTAESIIQRVENDISTHTLTWSVTCGGRGSSVINSEFQLTRSRGA